mgnify:FL=1
MTEHEAPQTVDEYIAACDILAQPKLRQLRKIIREAEPTLTERISWRMPTYRLNRDVIHFAANRRHVGVYPRPEAIEHFADRLSDYRTSKGAIQIPYDRELDAELLADLVQFGIDQQATAALSSEI